MKIIHHSHNYGNYAVKKEMYEHITFFLENLSFNVKNGSSRQLRILIEEELSNLGWSDKVKIHFEKEITITSLKDEIGLCLQTGNMSRFYADLLKLQTLYIKDKIKAAIYIIPTKRAAKIMGDNLANAERLVAELILFRHVITVPIAIIAIDQGGELNGNN
jgi:hypothetical protein